MKKNLIGSNLKKIANCKIDLIKMEIIRLANKKNVDEIASFISDLSEKNYISKYESEYLYGYLDGVTGAKLPRQFNITKVTNNPILTLLENSNKDFIKEGILDENM